MKRNLLTVLVLMGSWMGASAFADCSGFQVGQKINAWDANSGRYYKGRITGFDGSAASIEYSASTMAWASAVGEIPVPIFNCANLVAPNRR